MRTARLLTALGCLASFACAAAPQARYRRALDQRRAGETAAYYREMVALAAQVPDSRGGRRARAALQGNGWLGDWALFSGLAAGLSPPPGEAAADGEPEALQREAQDTLRQIAAAQRRHRAAHGRFCRSFFECGIRLPKKAHYFYFLSPTEVAGGSDSQTTVELEGQIRALLQARGIVPFVEAGRFLCVAAGTDGGGTRLSAWSIDAEGEPRRLTP